jgi:hypothetical protein
MKIKILFTALFLAGSVYNSDAQILKNLKKKIEQTIQKIDNNKEKTPGAESENFNVNYGKDMKIEIAGDDIDDHRLLYDKNNGVVSLENKVTDEKHFIDAAGYRYIKRNNKYLRTRDANEFENTPEIKLKKFTKHANLPKQPLLDYYSQLPEEQSSLKSFDPINWPLVYTAEHFQTAGFKETIAEDYKHGKQFNFSDPDYSGSKIRFDEYGRLALVEIHYTGKEGTQNFSYNYAYGPVAIYLPKATTLENPFQGIVEDVMAKTNNPTGSRTDSKNPNGDSPSTNNPNTPTPEDPTINIPSDNSETVFPKKKKPQKKGEADPVPIELPKDYKPDYNKSQPIRTMAIRIQSKGRTQTYTVDLTTMKHEIDYEGFKGPDGRVLEPTYYDGSMLYTWEHKKRGGGRYLCVVANLLMRSVMIGSILGKYALFTELERYLIEDYYYPQYENNEMTYEQFKYHEKILGNIKDGHFTDIMREIELFHFTKDLNLFPLVFPIPFQLIGTYRLGVFENPDLFLKEEGEFLSTYMGRTGRMQGQTFVFYNSGLPYQYYGYDNDGNWQGMRIAYSSKSYLKVAECDGGPITNPKLVF